MIGIILLISICKFHDSVYLSSHQEVNIGQYNLQVMRTMYNMRRMVTFHPKDVDRLQKILYPRVGLLRDLHCLPVWVIENLNRHPEELAGCKCLAILNALLCT